MRKTLAIVLLIIVVCIVGAGGYIYYTKFEGSPPSLNLSPQPTLVGQKNAFSITVRDEGTGLKDLSVDILQEAQVVSLLSEQFPSKSYSETRDIEINPSLLGLEDGDAVLKITVGDSSWRDGGNRKAFEFPFTIDTKPPRIATLSRFHYVTQGGTGLVIYRASEDLQRSGVAVGDRFYPGFVAGDEGYIGLFAMPFDAPPDISIRLVAEDLAGNAIQTPFPYRIKKRAFKHDNMTVSDGFLDQVMPYFMAKHPEYGNDKLEAYLKVNSELRAENARQIEELCRNSAPLPLWEGKFLQMPRARKMADFADQRTYYYNGREVSRSVHYGVDLASTAMSPVQAANRGEVVYADDLGIYGNTVILDHGCGLFSIYSHLSLISAEKNELLEKGEELGLTGNTGLAGGDHLHFGMMIFGTPVHPIEWWDSHWVSVNIDEKLNLVFHQEE